MTNSKTTPLTEVHRSLGARMVDFAGFLMPVAYGSILAEHEAVRERAGVFDVGHMGEFVVTGRRAQAFVNEIITNDCSKLEPGALQYTVMCRDDGTVVDDLLVFRVDEERMILVVNASNIEKDLEHVLSFDRSGVDVRNASDDYALIAVQGPRARDVLKRVPRFEALADRIDTVPYYNGFRFESEGSEILVSRTGYTGEVGFEIFTPPALAKSLWGEILDAGEPLGLQPIGLGARDTLRFEASYCLYGHELDDETSPLEAGLGWVVKLKKERFRGRDALRKEKDEGSRRALIGLELEGRNIARQGYAVLRNGERAGKVTSGAFAPTLRKSLCMALVDNPAGADGASYAVEIRGKAVPAVAVGLPFYKSRAK